MEEHYGYGLSMYVMHILELPSQTLVRFCYELLLCLPINRLIMVKKFRLHCGCSFSDLRMVSEQKSCDLWPVRLMGACGWLFVSWCAIMWVTCFLREHQVSRTKLIL